MIGSEFLPQTSVLPHVDAVITHGGNNTHTACMRGTASQMLVLPIFWDQHQGGSLAWTGSPSMRSPPRGTRILAAG
jgi:UDP:flavonoid glycosyltransferase YjiC (YdhE family)